MTSARCKLSWSASTASSPAAVSASLLKQNNKQHRTTTHGIRCDKLASLGWRVNQEGDGGSSLDQNTKGAQSEDTPPELISADGFLGTCWSLFMSTVLTKCGCRPCSYAANRPPVDCTVGLANGTWGAEVYKDPRGNHTAATIKSGA